MHYYCDDLRDGSAMHVVLYIHALHQQRGVVCREAAQADPVKLRRQIQLNSELNDIQSYAKLELHDRLSYSYVYFIPVCFAVLYNDLCYIL